MKDSSSTLENQEIKYGSYKSYVKGFVLSIIFTLMAYFFTVEHVFTGWKLDAMLIGLSLCQVFVQLIFFLHLLDEAKPRNNLMIFLFMVLVIAILVGGTLWIMNNLDYRMMPKMNIDIGNLP